MATANVSVSITCTDGENAPLAVYNGSPGIAGTITLASTQITTGVYQATGTISSGTSITVNNGSIANAYNSPLTYTTVQAVVIANTGTAKIVVGGGSNPLFGSDQYTVQPGQILVIPNVPVTVSSSAKQLTLTPSASTTYQILIVG